MKRIISAAVAAAFFGAVGCGGGAASGKGSEAEAAGADVVAASNQRMEDDAAAFVGAYNRPSQDSGLVGAGLGGAETLELFEDGTFVLKTNILCIQAPCPQGDSGLWYMFKDADKTYVQLLTMAGDVLVPVRDYRARIEQNGGQLLLEGMNEQSGGWVAEKLLLVPAPCSPSLCY
jgi:hypothetical protein